MTFTPPDPTSDLGWSDFRGAIHDIFADNARQFPDRICVTETKSRGRAQRTFTYAHIYTSSNKLASRLLAHGCQIGDVVTIYAYRGVDLVVAYMGALKAGATVCVLDPQYPPERQIVLLGVARPRFLIFIERANEESGKPSEAVMEYVSSHLKIKDFIPALQLTEGGQLLTGDTETDVPGREEDAPVVGPDTAPTLSFTSGSEGRPKGVLGRHFSLTYYFEWMAERFTLSKKDRFTMLSGIGHDPIQRDIFTPLFLGAQIVIPPAEVITYGELAEWAGTYNVTVMHLTPAMAQILVGGAETPFPALQNAFVVGDLLTLKDTRRLRDLAPNTSVTNLYGTTETQRAVSFFEIPSKSREPLFLDSLPNVIPIGQGMRNVQLLVVDLEDRTRVCKVGEQGELFVRAGGLAEGYLGDDEETKKLNTSKFLNNWFVEPDAWKKQYEQSGINQPWIKQYKGPRDRIYRTGDLGRYLPNGDVECTGRIDNQVKIRGFRIELGEIDIALSQHPYVRENITLVRRNMNEEATLVTYIVPETYRWFKYLGQQEEGQEIEQHISEKSMGDLLRRFRSLSEDCKKFLATKLPKYGVPSIIIPLARMPLNPNGKIDKPSLPFPDTSDLQSATRRRTSSVARRMTDTQIRLSKIWATVLPNKTARMLVPESNFFDEGGHSILVQQLFFLLKRDWKNIDLPLQTIFQSQTLDALAAEIDRAQDPIGLRLDTMPLTSDAGFTDEAYAADARGLVDKLPASIPAAPISPSKIQTVFLTGATGFLGSYILRELLEISPAVQVIVLMRAKTTAEALTRLQSTSTQYGLWSSEWQSRIEVVVGDLGQPRLALSTSVWEGLAEKVDLIVHNGAQVNWMLPYSSLRPANVLSTMACIQLCSTGRAKRLAFVSSTATLDNDYYGSELVSTVSENDDLGGSGKGLGTGYGQSKWTSEYIMRMAGQRGLVGAVIRPGYVTGDPTSGISITDDFLVRLWKGCIQVGAMPEIDSVLNAVPVTHVSRIVVAAALHLPVVLKGRLGVAQVTSHPRRTMNEWMAALPEYGFDVPRISYSDWCTRVRTYVGDGTQPETFALLPLFHFVIEDLPAKTKGPSLEDAHASAALQAYGVSKDAVATTAVDTTTLGHYLAYLVAVGFIPAPGRQGTHKLPEVEASKLEALSGRLKMM